MLNTGQDTAWNDFDTLRHNIKSYTVEKLKHIITGLSEECNANISKSGKKQDLIDRITRQLDEYRYMQRLDVWNKARAVLYQVRNNGCYTKPSKFGHSPLPTHLNGINIASSVSKAHQSAYATGTGLGQNSSMKYDSYTIPPRMPSTSSVASPKTTSNTIKFSYSPFFRVDQSVTSVVECPESTGQMDRKSQSINFYLSQDQINKLSLPTPQYQLRLYCTSSTFYTTSHQPFRSMSDLCPIEFPPTCEVRVNNIPISANLKGLKKKPGTAPPADLGKTIRLSSNSQNRVDMIYVNSQQPVASKKYYMTVLLVEVTSTEQLIERLRKGKFRSIDEMRTRIIKAASEDDDIVVGRQTVSLKCPLSYTRINLPCRSDKCVHIQCFDASIFYSVMEQTTTWQCPTCERILNPDDLIIDGYFADILQQTPDSIEEVIVEPNAEWHTTNNKFGSAAWLASHSRSQSSVSQKLAPKNLSQDPPKVLERADTGNPQGDVRGPTSWGEIVIIDSEDEEEEKTESHGLTHSVINGHTQKLDALVGVQGRPSGMQSVVIDLTEDSDVEDTRSLLSNKRKIGLENNGPPLKRSRPEQTGSSTSALHNNGGAGNFSGARLNSINSQAEAY